MSDLDLPPMIKRSDLEKQNQEPVGSSNELDLSFVMTRREMADRIAERPAPAPLSFIEKAKDLFTGNARETQQQRDLPELHTSGLLAGESMSTTASLAPILQTMTDPDEIVKTITSRVPNVVATYNKDAQGNVYPILTNRENGASTIINRPGLSGFDVLQGLSIGAAFTPAARAGSAASSVLPKMASVAGRSAVTQSAIEGGHAASGGEFDPGEVAVAAVAGGMFEGVAHAIGKAIPVIARQIRSGEITDEVRVAFKLEGKRAGLPEEDVTDEVIKAWASKLDDRTGLEREFNTTLTRGQRSNDQALLSREDSIRSGILGEKPQAAYLQGERTQLRELTSAANVLQGEIARGAPRIAGRQEAGAAVREGVRNAERIADDAIKQAYGEVGDATLSPDGFRALLRATRTSTNAMEYPKVGNVQAWEGLQKSIKHAENSLTQLAAKPGTTLKPVHITHLDNIRKAIGNAADAAGSPADKRNILAMKSAFDEHLDNAVIDGLFSGDEAALGSLKAARRVHREYMTKFGQRIKSSRLGRGTDQEGAFLKKIILEDPTDEQVINSLWGASSFNKQSGASLAKRYKEILKPESEEWQMVRQAAFIDLVATKRVGDEMVVDGARTLTNFTKAEKQNASLIAELFTPQEWGKLKRFSVLAKRTAPDLVRSRENPSGTAQKLAKSSLSILRSVLPYMDMGVSMAGEGAVVLRNSRNTAAARQAFKPFANVRKSLMGQAFEGGAIGAAVGASPLLDTDGESPQSFAPVDL